MIKATEPRLVFKFVVLEPILDHLPFYFYFTPVLCFSEILHQYYYVFMNYSHDQIIDMQVAEPLRAMVGGAPLEDARRLAQRYDRMRQEAEAQVSCNNIT